MKMMGLDLFAIRQRWSVHLPRERCHFNGRSGGLPKRELGIDVLPLTLIYTLVVDRPFCGRVAEVGDK